jgi:Predicted signal-transduction protein containing cAMP-binding and CBS domains
MAILSRFVVTVSRTASVLDAIQAMAGAKVGSVAVVDGNILEGIFSERDVMLRVVAEGRDPKTTAVEEVMTSPVQTIQKRTTGEEALRIMVQNHIRHLPVVDEMGQAQAMVSMRSLLEEQVHDLHQQLDSLESYITPTASAAKQAFSEAKL